MVKPYKESELTKKAQVAEMFDNIAHKYDLLNHVLSFGIDRLWRRRAVNLLKKESPKRILDVATGTGDFALESVRLKPQAIVGVDISQGMLDHGIEKIEKKGLSSLISFQKADSEHLPFEDDSFDAITVGFGVRNFENLLQGLKEFRRVIKPGGAACILEFSQPRIFPFKQLYNLYSFTIMPFFGKLISKDASAYTYLPESVQEFPDGEDFIAILKDAGFTSIKEVRLTFGIATIYFAK